MSFETPAAFWALGSLLLLAIFSLWRQAAVRTVVPSLRLWKLLPERNPPLRALRRPAWRWELLCSAAAVACLTAGLAGPFLTTERPRPRKIGIVIDTSARLRGRLDRMVARARELQAGPLAGDAVTYYGADPSLRSAKDPGAFKVVDVHVDVEAALGVARAENERVVLFSDRAAEGVEAELFDGPAGNVGVVEFQVSDPEVFARLVNHGAARRVAAWLEIDGRRLEREIELPAGERGWSEKGDYSKATSVALRLKADDGFPTDDAAGALRLAPPETAVALRGLDVPLLKRALTSVPGVILRDADPAIAVGVDEDPGPAPLRVRLHVPAASRQATVAPVAHPLTEGLRMSEIGSAGVGELPAGAGTPLLLAEGKPVLALQGTLIQAAIDLAPERWPSTPSFPIFWANVIHFARGGRAGFATPRTGRPFPLLTYAAGEQEAEGRRWLVGLLDPRESDAAGTSRRLSWGAATDVGRERVRRPLGGAAALLGLVFVVLAWILQRRTD